MGVSLRVVAGLRGSLRMARRSPLRALLLGLGALVGVAGSTTAVNYARGGREKIALQLGRMGTNVLVLSPQQSRSVAGRARTGELVTTLVEADAAAATREVPLLVRRAAFVTQSFLVKARGLRKNSCTVVGAEPDYLRIKQWLPREGSLPGAAAERRSARIAVLGSTVARDLFADASPLGAHIQINRVPFEVVGVLSERGQSLDAANEDDRIFVPLSTMTRRLTNVDHYSGVLFSVGRWEDMDRAADEVRAVLHLRHRARAKLPDDFQVQSQKRLLETQLATSEQLLGFVRWIAAGTLLMSGLGALAISAMSVRDRRPEIGLRRALGATRRDIFVQFLREAALLGGLGCAAGAALALPCSALVARLAGQPRVFDGPTLSLAVASTLSLTLLFAAIPAQVAAAIDPIAALRSE